MSNPTELPDLGKLLTACRVALVSLAHAAEKHGIYQTDYERFLAVVEEFVARRAQPEGEAPQAVQPVLTVWNGPMPESNGKSNFTAILMRKGGKAWDGITLDRSEYPDRVRYEADRVRYLLGELAEPPFILDYDADKRSGYVEPTATLSPLCGAQHAESGKEATVYESDDQRIEAVVQLEGYNLPVWEHKAKNGVSETKHWHMFISATSLDEWEISARSKFGFLENFTEIGIEVADVRYSTSLREIVNLLEAQRAAQLDGGQEGSESNG
jgi:hypothetical protein